MTEQLRQKARELLSSGQVACVIGYRRGSSGRGARPAFARTPEEADQLIFDESCTHNLAKYLLEKRDQPTAIVAKPCDTFAINVLLQERQLEREKVYIIGLTCTGVVEVGYDTVGEALQGRCLICREHTPPVYDLLIGEPVEERPLEEDPYARVKELEAMSTEERVAFWQRHFERCIRCYACRNVCPQCYCTECVAETIDPEWVGIPIATPEKQIFHIIRAFHLAGRCVGCNECERVCPVGIPLSLLNMKFSMEVEERFGYRPGRQCDVPAPLQTFVPDEDLGIGEK
jgi:coenzyme F420-reducing hydrogenase beta subunit